MLLSCLRLQLRFEGVRGSSYTGDAAIDNVRNGTTTTADPNQDFLGNLIENSNVTGNLKWFHGILLELFAVIKLTIQQPTRHKYCAPVAGVARLKPPCRFWFCSVVVDVRGSAWIELGGRYRYWWRACVRLSRYDSRLIPVSTFVLRKGTWVRFGEKLNPALVYIKLGCEWCRCLCRVRLSRHWTSPRERNNYSWPGENNSIATFTPKSEQFKISPAALPEILHHTVWRTWLFITYSYQRWLYYQFSLHHL